MKAMMAIGHRITTILQANRA
jgi:hypothetical protein